MVRLTSSYHSPTRGYVVKTYAADEVDLVAVYCEATGKSYLLPIETVAGLGLFTLRLSPARNNQRAALNFAADYEFPGAVAQLEERVAGSDEVRGSSPLSSTQDGGAGSASAWTASMPALRTTSGRPRRRRGGCEPQGRPVARLVPAVLNPVASGADE